MYFQQTSHTSQRHLTREGIFFRGEMYGECAVEMLRELKNSKWLPVYNEESMRKVTREIETLYTNIDKTLKANRENAADPTIACGLVVNNQSLLRNKRCALAYLTNRLDRLQDLWWQTGSVMPPEAKVAFLFF